MDEIINKESVQRQESIFRSYLERFGIAESDPHAMRIFAKISTGDITTFKEESIQMRDGSGQLVTFLEMHGGVFDKGTWRGLGNKDADIALIQDLVTVGFTVNIFDKEPAKINQFTAILRGDGIPKPH